MKVKYLGPSDQVFVEPYGRHWKDKVKEYPDEFAEELLATSVKQHFEIVDAGKAEKEVEAARAEEPAAEEPATEIELQPETDELVDAARAAIEAGKVTKEGKPLVEAIEEILGRDISAADRDKAWEKISHR